MYTSIVDGKLYPSKNNSANYKYIIRADDCVPHHSICILAIHGLLDIDCEALKITHRGLGMCIRSGKLGLSFGSENGMSHVSYYLSLHVRSKQLP